MVKYVNGKKTDEWLPKHWRKTTFPILREPAIGPDDIIGSVFLLQYQGAIFIVSAKHVIDSDSLVIVLPTKERKVLPIPLTSLEEAGAQWVHHPAGRARCGPSGPS